MSSSITLSRVTRDDAALLDRLWQFYELESSFWSGEEVDESARFNSLSDFMGRLGDPNSFDWAYLIRHEGLLAGLLVVGHQNLRGRSIMEFADLYILPRHRRRGIASELIRQVVLDSNEPWLICVFREDRQALDFWRRAFERLPFSSVREALPSEDPDLHEFIVNDVPAEIDAAAAADGTAGAGSA